VKLKSPPTVKDAELFWHLGVNATTFESNGADLIEQILPGADGPDWNTSWGRGEILQPDARVYAQLESLRRQAAQIIIAAASMKTDDAFSCHRAIVVGPNETATDRALDQLDSKIGARFDFDHILLGESWDSNIGYHFPGQKEGGLAGLVLDNCPYSNLMNASCTQWEQNYDRCMVQHISTLPYLFDHYGTFASGRKPIDKNSNWTGLIVRDVESWEPSWQDSAWSLDVGLARRRSS
jgi:hypothetical protein